MGFLFDLFISKAIGTNMVVLGVSGFLGGIFDKNFSKEKLMNIMLMVAGTTILCEFIVYIIRILFLNTEFAILQFIYIVLIETIYNIILVIVLNPMIQKIGPFMEENFRKEKTFSKYL